MVRIQKMIIILTEWIKHTNDYDQNDNNNYDKNYPHLKTDSQVNN